MDAKQTCEHLLSYIKKSNLNWSIIESPFTVTVTLKKSFIRNKDGSFCELGLEESTFTNNYSSSLMKYVCPTTIPDRTPSMQQIPTIPLKIPNDPSSTQTEHLLHQLAAAGPCKPNHHENAAVSQLSREVCPNQNNFPPSLQQKALVNSNPYYTKNTLSSSMHLQALINHNPYTLSFSKQQ